MFATVTRRAWADHRGRRQIKGRWYVATSDRWYPDVKKLWTTLQDAWHGEAKQWTFGRLPSGQILDGQEPIQDRPIKPNEEYIGVNLRSLWIVNSRVGWTSFYPAVHAYISAPAFLGQDDEFHVLTTPADIKQLTSKGLDRVIVGNQRLLGPVPYWGGDLKLELALFAIKAEDLAAPFLSVLGDLSAAAGGAFGTTAMAFAEPLKNGIALLTGGGSDSLEIGYFADAEQPRTGYYTAIRAEGRRLADLWLKDGYLVDGRGQPLRDAPYFVFSLDATASRSDWRKLPGLDDAWAGVTSATKDGDKSKLESAYERVKRIVYASDDLLIRQVDEIIAELDAKYANMLRGVGLRGLGEVEEPSLQEIDLPSLVGVAEPDATVRRVDPVPIAAPG